MMQELDPTRDYERIKSLLTSQFTPDARQNVVEMFPTIIQFTKKPPYDEKRQELFITTALSDLNTGHNFLSAVVRLWNMMDFSRDKETLSPEIFWDSMKARSYAAGIVDSPESLINIFSNGLLSLAVDIDMSYDCQEGTCLCDYFGHETHWYDTTQKSLPSLLKRIIQPLTGDSITGTIELRYELEHIGINPEF